MIALTFADMTRAPERVSPDTMTPEQLREAVIAYQSWRNDAIDTLAEVEQLIEVAAVASLDRAHGISVAPLLFRLASAVRQFLDDEVIDPKKGGAR